MSCVDPEPTEWNLMLTDEGVELQRQMGIDGLGCDHCVLPATFLQAAPDGTAGAYWCTAEAERRGAPHALLSLARS
jgi:hypothetical protein